jgi:anti-anti-sigma factor
VTTVEPAAARFGVAVDFAGEQALLGVQGDIDLLGVSALGAFFDAVITSGYTSVVLDLAEVDSIDVTLGAVIASAASRLVAMAGRLTIRSPSPEVARVLDLTWLAAAINLEFPRPTRERLGSEQSTLAGRLPIMTTPPDSGHLLSEATVIHPNDVYVDSALRLVVALAQVTVGGADGASVSLQRHGRLGTVAASDQTVSDMDANQYATGEGPCVDASVVGRRFHAESLEEETRWPAFTPKARALGIGSILSSPLLDQGGPAGALNIYSKTASAFGPKDQALAARLAVEASNLLSDVRVHATNDDQRSRRLHGALRTREIIAEAYGVIMERENVLETDAFAMLRRFSQTSNRPLLERAEDVVASTRRPRPDQIIRP